MAMGYADVLRNAQLDSITTYAGTAALLRIYDGTRPAKGGAATTKVAEFTMGSPFAPTLGSTGTGLLSPSLPGTSTGLALGTASWARIVRTDGSTHVMDLSVTGSGSGGDIQLNTTIISSGVAVSITAATILCGNA